MKKILCALLAVLLLCSLCACGKAAPKETEPADKKNESTVNTQPMQENTKVTEPSKGVSYIDFQLPRTLMYCKVPEDCSMRSNAAVAICQNTTEYMGTVFCGDENAYTGELEGILAFLSENYVYGVNKFLVSKLNKENLVAKNTQRITVSGCDAVKFSGPITNNDGGTSEVYGYVMILETRPVVFLGIVDDKKQEQKDIDAMKALVDQMAGSIYKK